MELQCRGQKETTLDNVQEELRRPSPVRVWAVAKAFELGLTIEKIHELSRIDRWFLAKLRNIDLMKRQLRTIDYTALSSQPALLQRAKRTGFSDVQIAALLSEGATRPITSPGCGEVSQVIVEKHVRQLRQQHNIRPVVN